MKKKALLLLAVIYLAFIALGLPDAVLGSAWSLIHLDLNQTLEKLGFMTVIVYSMSVLSTFNAPRILRFLETKKVVFISILFTGTALVFISRVEYFYQMLFFAIPLGIGAGAIDVSLNHYLAANYKAKHMNYLHSFYGIGVTAGPTIMAYTLSQNSWRLGYVYVGAILILISIVILISFKLWKKESQEERDEKHSHITVKEIIKTRGVIASVLIFLFYVNVESLGGIWISSYYYFVKDISHASAALFASTFYLALTVGRLLGGVFSGKVKPNTLIKAGEILIVVAGVFMFIQVEYLWFYFIVVFLFGFGCAPIFPNMMYMNSENFDKSKLSKVISLQMAIGYVGFGVLTPLAGVFFKEVSISYYPFFIVTVGVIILMITLHFMKKVKSEPFNNA